MTAFKRLRHARHRACRMRGILMTPEHPNDVWPQAAG